MSYCNWMPNFTHITILDRLESECLNTYYVKKEDWKGLDGIVVDPRTLVSLVPCLPSYVP